MKPLIVGAAPVRGSPAEAGTGPAFVATGSGRRLAKYVGLKSDAELPEHFDLVNLLTWSLDANLVRQIRALPWPPRSVTRPLAALLVKDRVVEQHQRVVLMGGGVANAFDVPYGPWFTWWPRTTDGWRWVVATCPHPSGLTRAWNDHDVVFAARKFLRAAAGLG